MDISEVNLYRVTPRQLRPLLIEVLEAGLVPMVTSDPGMGKSDIFRSIFKEFRLWMIDQRVSTMQETDLTGLPRFENGFAQFAPFLDVFPIQGISKIPEGYDGWAVFFDEMNSGERNVIAATYNVILDRLIGQHHLHEKVILAAAGNLETSRAIVNEMGTAMQSRLIHFELQVSFTDWLEDYALPNNFDPRIISFLSQYPSKLMDFTPDHKNKTFSCPRTWSFMNRLIKGKEVTDSRVPMYAGTISAPMAAEFAQYTKIFANIVTLRDVLSGPDTCPVPGDNSLKWATICMLMEHVDEKNYDALTKYTERFDSTMQIVFFRAVQIRKPELRHHPAFIRNMSTLSKYMHGRI